MWGCWGAPTETGAVASPAPTGLCSELPPLTLDWKRQMLFRGSATGDRGHCRQNLKCLWGGGTFAVTPIQILPPSYSLSGATLTGSHTQFHSDWSIFKVKHHMQTAAACQHINVYMKNINSKTVYLLVFLYTQFVEKVVWDPPGVIWDSGVNRCSVTWHFSCKADVTHWSFKSKRCLDDGRFEQSPRQPATHS